MTSAPFPRRPKKIYAGMPSGAFAHPADRRRLRRLKTIPGIEWLTNLLVKHSYERMVRVTLMANAIQVSQQAFPVLDDLLEVACDSLDVPRPGLFVSRGEAQAVRTTGSERPIIVLSADLLETLSEEEMLCVLSEQVSHIHCGHLWYLMVCDFTRDCYEFLGPAGAPLLGLRLPLEEWRRRAELSCDRGALLVCDDLSMQLGLLAKRAGAGKGRFGDVQIGALLEQEKAFTKDTKGVSLGRLYRSMMYMDPSAPFAALRAGELSRWANGEEYALIRNGEYAEPGEPDERPLWGEYVHSAETGHSPVEPVESPADMFIGGLRNAADGAAGIVVQGAGALQSAVEGFLGHLHRSSDSDGSVTENAS